MRFRRRGCSVGTGLDRRRAEMGSDHDRDYRDGHENDLRMGGIALVLMVMLHLEVHRGSLSLSLSSAAVSSSSNPSP
jgi:hypothetical protein